MSISRWLVVGCLVLGGTFWLGTQLHNRSLLWADAPRELPPDGVDGVVVDGEQLLQKSNETRPQSTSSRVVGFGHVDVEGGTVPLTVPNVGQVAEVLVAEGDRVEAGQPMIRLRDNRARAQLAQADAQVEQARIQLQIAQRAPELLKFKSKLQTQAIAAAEARLESAKSELDRLKNLVNDSVAPSEKFSSAQERFPELQAALEVERLRFEELDLQRPDDALKLATTSLDAAEAQRDLAQEYLDTHTLLAPVAGTVLRVMVAQGQMLGSNATMPALWFCPDSPRIIRCEIDEEFANRVTAGMRAEIFTDELGSISFSGKVTRCAEWIAHRRSLLDEPFQRNDVRTLECIVSLEDAPSDVPALRIGRRMRVVLHAE